MTVLSKMLQVRVGQRDLRVEATSLEQVSFSSLEHMQGVSMITGDEKFGNRWQIALLHLAGNKTGNSPDELEVLSLHLLSCQVHVNHLNS